MRALARMVLISSIWVVSWATVDSLGERASLSLEPSFELD